MMNERIKELMVQAGAIKCHGYIPHPELDGHLIWAADAALDTKKMDAEKFAELIVQEMLAITDAHTEVFQTDRDKALIEHIKQSVKQHFGVEL